MPQPICIITPCFNANRFLKSCLRSVEAQGVCVSRHIVMDGGSDDGSTDVLREFANTHPSLMWFSEADAGQSDALNKALALVDTAYFGWLNADDCYLPSGLTSLIQATSTDVDQRAPAIVYGDYQVIDSENRVLRRRKQPSFDYWDCLYSYLTVQNCAAIFSTALCRNANGFDSDLNFCMDYDLVLRLASAGPVKHVKSYVGCFRQHEGSKTSRLQQVCEEETQRLRIRISGKSGAGLRWRYRLGRARVLGRMLMEGCIKSRVANGLGEYIEV